MIQVYDRAAARRTKTIFPYSVTFLLQSSPESLIFHIVGMKDKVTQLTTSRKQLLQQVPDLSTILPGSLLSRMVRCNKPRLPVLREGQG